jgi:hypothetical protein
MSKFKNIPGLVWLVIGVLVTLLVIPSTAYAAALKFTGIEGTSTNKADVTPAGQLLTTEANPTTFRTYFGNIDALSGGGCSPLTPALPTGEAFDLRDLSVSFLASNVQVTAGGTNTGDSSISLFAAPTSVNFCSSLEDYAIVAYAVPQGGQTGNIDLPENPGFVVPNGYQVYLIANGLESDVTANGYLIPSNDAPATPEVQSQGQANLLPKP